MSTSVARHSVMCHKDAQKIVPGDRLRPLDMRGEDRGWINIATFTCIKAGQCTCRENPNASSPGSRQSHSYNVYTQHDGWYYYVCLFHPRPPHRMWWLLKTIVFSRYERQRTWMEFNYRDLAPLKVWIKIGKIRLARDNKTASPGSYDSTYPIYFVLD